MNRIVKKFLCISMVGVMLLGSFGCGKKEEDNSKKKITVYAATSLADTLRDIGELYEKNNQDIDIVFKFGASGELKKEIQSGADCDVFISATQKSMNQIDITYSDNETGVNYIEHGTRKDLLVNKVVLVVASANNKKINGFEKVKSELASKNIKVAIGNSNSGIGYYTQTIFENLGINEEAVKADNLLLYCNNVDNVITAVKEGKADCGIVYSTDAKREKLVIVGEASASLCEGQVIYPAAVMEKSKDIDNAKKFLNYLSTEEAVKCFKDAGFVTAK